jgi:hypothetical protein
MDHTNEGQPLEQVTTINSFVQYYVTLLNGPSSVRVLQDIQERCNTKVEGKLDKIQSIISIQEEGQAENSK